MIISLEGRMGSGKSTMATALAYEDSIKSGRKVISNNFLNGFPNYQRLSLEWFLEHIADGEIEDCILCVDEALQLMDSRSSQSKMNKLWTYFTIQTRKRGVDMYLCAHYLGDVDVRNRRAVDIRGSCRYYEEKPCKKCKCSKCHGTGKIYGENCDECHGIGGTGLVHGEPCEYCLGYGLRGFVRASFLDRRIRRRYSSDVLFGGPLFSNKYWHMFNSFERIPMAAKALQGIDTAEIGQM